MLQAIKDRRSIRKYKTTPIPQEILEDVLQAGILAPSSKNRQPWKFTVVTGESKAEMLEVMKKGLEREKETPFLTESVPYISGAEHTLKIMTQAPVIVFIENPISFPLGSINNVEDHVSEICNAQSVGAAIENMILAATAHGLGSLWICDTYFTYEELTAWLGKDGKKTGELFAALALGYPDEAPSPRPRRNPQDTIEWRK